MFYTLSGIKLKLASIVTLQYSLNVAFLIKDFSTEEVVEELLNTARAIVSGEEESKKLNLSTEELAFYDAITKPEAVQDFYTNEQLIAITRELTDALRTNKTIDWTMKESARAGLRRIVKRQLKKYKYPPEGQEAALETIMTQCEMWSDNNI